MSLFASVGGGDVWSISGISFANAVSDILEKDSFTLEDLLQEDELLQEVKSRNGKLIEFLSSDDSVNRLVTYLVEPAQEGDNDLRTFKYPYVSCEIFCCEIQDILHTLVESEDSKLLKKLFSLLDLNISINTYLGGYFEKVLEMLFRRMTVSVIPFVNEGGVALLRRFLGKIDNYSIMQIVQRLMLPHIPFLIPNDADEVMVDDRQNTLCNWSSIPEACELLLERMLSQHAGDVPSHVSDLLITVLQLSPPDASILYHLCSMSCLEQLLAAAFADEADHEDVESLPSASASVSLAALSVLESLVSRICEAATPSGPEEGGNMEDASGGLTDDSDGQVLVQVQASIANICDTLSPCLPAFKNQLKHFIDPSNERAPCGKVAMQTKSLMPRLSHRGLLMVKLIESLIRLNNPEIDRQLLDSDVIVASLDLIFTFRFNSLLHLTVQKIVIMVIEGGSSRRQLQHSLLFKSGFLLKIMTSVGDRSSSRVDEEESKILSGARAPLLGHLVCIAQAFRATIQAEDQMTLVPDDDDDAAAASSVNADTTGGTERGQSPGSSSTSTGSTNASSTSANDSSLPSNIETTLLSTQPEANHNQMPDKGTADIGTGLRYFLGEHSMLETWDSFANQILKDIIESQSSFQVSVDRNEDDFGLLTLGDQLENGTGTSSSFEAFGLSARQNQQLKSHGTVGNNAVIATDWRRRNQIVVGGSDESGQQFTFDNADDIDDDDDYDGGNYGAAVGITHPGAVANFANFDDVNFEANFDFGFHTADASSMNADTSAGEERAQSPASSSTSIGSANASEVGVAHPGAVANFANFDDVSFEANFETVSTSSSSGPLGGVSSTTETDLFDFGPSSNNFDDIKHS